MGQRTRTAFLLLILVQAAHSTEEYVFALYDVFAPARFASELISSNPALGFALLNAAIVAFGAWCYLARIRPGRASAPGWMWPWVFVSLGNGVVHSTMAVLRGGYFPGVATAPILFVLAAFIAIRLVPGRRCSGSSRARFK